MPKVFISHTAADKPVVEPIAIELRKIFGEKEVFYDEWSIKPGDGIIEKMNEGLNAPKFFFFFVSENSKNSPMVKLEWQTAVMQATKGETRIIPIRVDGCDMPPIMLQNVYIDLHTQGMEATVHKIANLVVGNDGFSPQHQEFSNLTCSISGQPDVGFDIVISASHLLEMNPTIAFCVTNSEHEFTVAAGDGLSMDNFIENVKLSNGAQLNVAFVTPIGKSIAPKKPLRFTMKPNNGASLGLIAVSIQTTENKFEEIPIVCENSEASPHTQNPPSFPEISYKYTQHKS